jgi:hypothetical protein
MSVSVRKQRQYDCAFPDCDQTRTETSSVAGSYCSQDCADRHDGQRLLRQIETDHRFCWSCWRARKTIERPTDTARRGLGPVTDDALIGYEYATEHVEMGPHGLECSCGSVDHRLEGWDRRAEGPYHWHIKLIVSQLREEGQSDQVLDLATFADELWETDDLPLALGRALTE